MTIQYLSQHCLEEVWYPHTSTTSKWDTPCEGFLEFLQKLNDSARVRNKPVTSRLAT